jgi:hypothetical protein
VAKAAGRACFAWRGTPGREPRAITAPERADGTVLLFVDADVVVAPGTVSHVAAAFAGDAGLAACFGSYDDRPRAPGLVSRYRNLLHHFVHQDGNAEAATFWAGLGAVRRTIFLDVGGFDAARFPRPSIEDIELGYRLRRAGHRILLDKGLQGTHLKRWGLVSMIRTDDVPGLAVGPLVLRRRTPRGPQPRGTQRASAALTGLAGRRGPGCGDRARVAYRRRARRGGGDQSPVLRASLAPGRRPLALAGFGLHLSTSSTARRASPMSGPVPPPARAR